MVKQHQNFILKVVFLYTSLKSFLKVFRPDNIKLEENVY